MNTKRIHNFCAGPCTLPLSVLEQAQQELCNFQESGMSVMEISHRSRLFEPLHEETLALAQELLSAPNDFKTLLLPGGAHQQFCMIPLNLLQENDKAAYLDTGIWGKKAYDEAKRVRHAELIWSAEKSHYREMPKALKSRDYRYLHITSNETVNGTQFKNYPESEAPLVIDASSDYYTRDIPWQKSALVYGGVQKNLAPSGLALVFIHKDLLKEHTQLNKFFTYKAHADANSLYNTPPTFQIYILNLVLKWMKQQGGIKHFAQKSQEKSQKLYQYIDQSAFYQNKIPEEYRSKTNIIFTTPNAELDTLFWQQAEKEGLSGLKGHRLVGGLRASLYNALELSSVEALIQYMQHFAQQHQKL